MNTPLEYILVGIVTLGVLIYLILALLMTEKFQRRQQAKKVR
jgi:hypothetical protein